MSPSSKPTTSVTASAPASSISSSSRDAQETAWREEQELRRYNAWLNGAPGTRLGCVRAGEPRSPPPPFGTLNATQLASPEIRTSPASLKKGTISPQAHPAETSVSDAKEQDETDRHPLRRRRVAELEGGAVAHALNDGLPRPWVVAPPPAPSSPSLQTKNFVADIEEKRAREKSQREAEREASRLEVARVVDRAREGLKRSEETKSWRVKLQEELLSESLREAREKRELERRLELEEMARARQETEELEAKRRERLQRLRAAYSMNRSAPVAVPVVKLTDREDPVSNALAEAVKRLMARHEERGLPFSALREILNEPEFVGFGVHLSDELRQSEEAR